MIRRRGQSWIVEVYDADRGRAVHVKAREYGLNPPKTKREALELERLALSSQHRSVETVESFFSRWPDDYPSGPTGKKRGESTLLHYKERAEKFAKDYAKVPLRAISREDAREWGLLNKGRVPTLKVMFSDAMSDDLVESNPFDRIQFSSPGRKHLDPPTLEDVERLATAAGPDAGMIWWMFTTGMRVGEVCAAKWDGLEGNRYHVTEQFVKKLGAYGPCKHGSEGWVHVPDSTLRVLPPRRLDSPFIFHSKTGKPLTPANFIYLWYPIRAAAGFPGLDAHMLRHACASHLLNVLKVEPWMISKQLRHSDPSLVLRLYGHPSVDVALDAVGAAYTDSFGPLRLVSTDSSTERLPDVQC